MRRQRSFLPWLVWTVAAISYSVAVINRSSLASLGPATQQHFNVEATTLALFPMLQLVVYTALQIPVGMLLDRFGSTALILAGGVLMALGQLGMAVVPDVTLAIAARILLGAGDACTFISVMRLLPDWFTLRQLPVVGQLTGLIGQAGQLVSVTPLALAVSVGGWSSGFTGLAAVGILVVSVGALVLRDTPAGRPLVSRKTVLTRRRRKIGAGSGCTHLRELWRLPGVRLSYWLHFTSPFAANVFFFLWGTPFLIYGMGFSETLSRWLLSLMVFASMAASLLLGGLSARFAGKRVTIYLSLTGAIVAGWLLILAWPGVAPLTVALPVLLLTASGGPASLIAFEELREHVKGARQGFATGLVNTGGFTATIFVVLLVGLLLDAQGAGSPESFTLNAFKNALATQIPVWMAGIAAIVVLKRKLKQ